MAADDASTPMMSERFSLLMHSLQTLFAERTGLEQIENNPFESLAQEAMFRISSGSSSSRDMLHYMRIVSTHTRYSGDYSSLFGNWECVSLEGRNDK